MRVLTLPTLLLSVNEIGYLWASQESALLFFQFINARHEMASTALIPNETFGERGSAFGDEVMAAALINRLFHRCHTVKIREI